MLDAGTQYGRVFIWACSEGKIIMSHIANALDHELKSANRTAADVARATGITEAQLCRLKNGTQVWANPKDLAAHARLAAQCHARMLLAHLLDECEGPGAALINISLRAGAIPATPTPAKKILPPSVQQNLDTIANHIGPRGRVQNLTPSSSSGRFFQR